MSTIDRDQPALPAARSLPRFFLPATVPLVLLALTIALLLLGQILAPGFIDLHSHSGLMILADPRHEPKVRQGVTTEVIGVDGNSYAPFTNPADLHDFVILNGGLDGRPDDPGPADVLAGPEARNPGPRDGRPGSPALC